MGSQKRAYESWASCRLVAYLALTWQRTAG
jgi:hypothetical protein